MRGFLLPRALSVSFGIALLLVIVCIPLRWNGFPDDDRIDWTPLRPLSTREAASLLRGGDAVVIALDATTASLAVPRDPGAIRDSSGPIFIDQYYSEYTVSRDVLATELRRELHADDVQSFRSLNSPVPERSFRPSDLPWYALTEMIIVTVLLTGGWWAVQRLRWLWMRPLVALPICIGLMLGTGFYSPGLYDYDYFGQRIVLEWLALRVASPVLYGSILLSGALAILTIFQSLVYTIRPNTN